MSRRPRGPMDPDRFQMKDLKRRVTSLEKSVERQKVLLRSAKNDLIAAQEAIKVLRGMCLHLAERIS